MSRGIKILNGISEWIRESVGSAADNRGENDADSPDEPVENGENGENDADADEDEPDTDSDDRDSPVCCSAASNTDLTVLDEQDR